MTPWRCKRQGGRRSPRGFAVLAAIAVLAGLPVAAQAKPGSLDRSFANDGRKTTEFFNRHDRATSLAVQRDGRIVVVGEARKPGGPAHLAIARYRRDGRLDRSFSGDGKATPLRCGGPTAAAIQPNGRIVVAGSCTNLVVSRVRRDGTIDRSFGRNGRARAEFTGRASAGDMAIQADGKIVVVGHTHGVASGDDFLVMARFTRSGQLDPSFGDQGTIMTRFGTPADTLGYGLAIQDDGKLVVSGEVGNNWIVARFLVNGSTDPSFADDGVAFSAPKLIGQARDVAIQPDGKIVAAGRDFGASVVRFALGRYLPDGSFDESFGSDGAVHTVFGRDRPADGFALALAPRGKLVVAGTGSDGRDTRFALARYLPGGGLDRGFGNNGKVTTGFPNKAGRTHDDGARALALQRNGRIVLAGSSRPFRRSIDFALARYRGG